MPRVVLVLGVVLCVAGGCERLRGDPDAITVRIGGEPFRMSIASDDAARIQGLKGVTEIGPDGGMFFVFPTSQVRTFWMADCLVDIDVVFLDPQGRVTATHTMTVEPPRGADETRAAYERRLRHYSSVLPCQFAIELRAGTVERLGVKVNSKVPLDLPRLKALAR